MKGISEHLKKGPHLVIVGGGFAGIELVKRLNRKPIRVTLIDRNNYHTFQPLLYQVASGGLGPDAIAYPLRKLIGTMPNVIFRMADVISVNTEKRELVTDNGIFTYDYLCLANGAGTNFFGNNELEAGCLSLKSIPEALDLRSQILQELERILNNGNSTNSSDTELNFVVVGGGPTGVETAGALAEIRKNVLPSDYPELSPDSLKVHLIEASPKILAAMNEKSSAGALKFLREMGVNVMLNTTVQTFDQSLGILKLSTGETIHTFTVIWSAGVKGNTMNGIAADKIGRGNRYLVDEFNRIAGLNNVFAVGDVACMKSDPAYPVGHPMVAPVAVQQARLLSGNILNLIKGETLKPFTYFDKGSMATIGRHKAVFESFGFRMQGYIAWLGWMFLHLMLLVGYRNRLIVFVNWMWNYFSYQRAIRIIIRKYIPKSV